MTVSKTRLLETETVSIWDVECQDGHSAKGSFKCTRASRLVFPYRGVYMHHTEREDVVCEPNQVVFLNRGEPYRVSHPVRQEHASLIVQVAPPMLIELTPTKYALDPTVPTFKRARLRIDPRAQALVILLRHSLMTGAIELLEAETLALTLTRRALGETTSHPPGGSLGRQKLVDRAKLVLTSDLTRRWTLAQIAAEVGVSAVYLTQVFQQVEGVPLYRYQLRLRLARALDLLCQYDDLTALGLDLGFSSHSHFTAAFRQVYGRTPQELQRDVRLR
jgi:AraC-like DNA-binding protein